MPWWVKLASAPKIEASCAVRGVGEEAAGRGRQGEHLATALRAVGHKASVRLGWQREEPKQEQEHVCEVF